MTLYSIETSMVRMTLDETGVVVVVETNPDERHTAESMEADVDAYRTITDGQVLPVIWDVRQMGRPTPQGWRALIEQLPGVLASLAWLVDAESLAITGAFPEVIGSFLFPTRVFEDVESAREWSEQFVPEDLSLSHL